MVPDRRLGPRLLAAPGRVVAVVEGGGRAIRVGVVAGGEQRGRDLVEQVRGGVVLCPAAIGDVAGADEDRIALALRRDADALRGRRPGTDAVARRERDRVVAGVA